MEEAQVNGCVQKSLESAMVMGGHGDALEVCGRVT